MKYVIGLLFASSLLMTLNAHATNVWTGYKHIVSIEIVETGGFIIYFDSTISSTCTAAGTNSLYVYAGQSGLTADGAKAQLAAALAAMNAGLLVDVLYDDSTNQCFGRYLQVKSG